jgi:protein involved in polysaccharide export with SLBB domain
MGEASAEAALEKTLEENKVSTTAGDDIYGHALFMGQSLDVFRTTDGAEAPDTYVLGEGDEIHISIFGSSQTEIHQRIAADGSIQPAGSSKIFLKGMTLGQARNAIRSKLSQHYSFRQDQIAVTLSTARTVSVSIYGEVGVQGGFTVSALNTAFNALAAAGGVTAIGSVREIQISRGGKTHTLDLYKYMKGAVSGSHYDLQNGDVLFVPVAKKIVTVNGAVNRPMRYEVIDNETIADALEFAGGPTLSASRDFVQLQRRDRDHISYTDYDLKQVLDGKQKVILQNGDVVNLRGTASLEEQYVAIEGDVYFAGRYDIRKNHSLLTLLANAQPRYTAKTDYVFIERTKDDETVEVLTIPYPGISGHPDVELQPRDKVVVMEQSSYRDVATISVNGAVRKPFTRDFGLNDRMTIDQAIEYAGGIKPTTFPVAYIFRKDVSNPEKMQYIRVNLEKDGKTTLMPGDQLNVYDNTKYTNVGEVSVSGAVKNSVNITYDSSITLHDLLMMAGGFDLGAAYNRVEVFRVNISKTDEVEYDLVSLTVDDEYYPLDTNFQLQPYDHVVVRRTPNFATGRSVEVNGRVKYPGEYVLEDGRTHLSEIIQLAGGLLDDASPYVTLLRTYKNRGPIGLNLNDMNRHKKEMNADPILMEGDVVTINRAENTVVIRTTGTRMNQYVPEEYTADQKTIVYQGPHNAGWYIKHYAGGFDKYAERRSVTVTMPNYQTDGTKVFIFRKYPTVQPGSVITLRMDQDKIDDHNRKVSEPKERADFEGIIAKSLSGITSIASIIILARNLSKN